MELVQNPEMQPCKTKDSAGTSIQLTRGQDVAESRLAGSIPSIFCAALLTMHNTIPPYNVFQTSAVLGSEM